ncbi:hypothetical protein ScPMuIL_016728 [Solemya velum]
MSLFKARDWWSTSVSEAEEFDQGCLCVANIDNNADGLDKIVVGSYQGILRIYQPHPVKSEDGLSGFSAEDVMLESALTNPIIQIQAGKFLSGSEELHLAVLHPRKLSVYNISSHSGARTAYNFCHGSFGGVSGRDFICVQSMDGAVSVYEQDCFAFSRFLPGALLPGPIKYISRNDSFITVSSSWQVESYRYQVLAVATDAKSKEESENIKSGKRVTYDWSFNIGEQALDVSVVASQQTTSVLILGERNLFCLSDNGNLKFMKKFEFDVSCFYPYAALSEGTVNYLVVTHTRSLMVFQNITLKWAAQLDYVPVQLQLATFKELKGVIVSLSDNGKVECSYLGTDPALFVAPPTEAREINYGEMDHEMSRLQKVIKEKSNKSMVMPNLSKVEEDLQLSVHVNPALDDVSMATNVEVEDPDPVPSITVRIQMKSRLALENVRLNVHVQWPLAANQTSFEIIRVDPSKPSESFVAFFLRGKSLPPDLCVQVSAMYKSSTGAPRIMTAKITLPLKLIMKPVLPVKMAEHKLTIDTNKPPVNLNEIFPDLLGMNAGGPGSALGFQLYGGPVITVLASKTSQRYRLQCDRYEAMWLVTKEMCVRLESHFNRSRVADFHISYSSQLPLQELFDLVDTHFEYRLSSFRCKDMLAQRASQFRAVQLRLLTRFKDKTPAPLSNLDTLLEGTYRQILHLADTVEENNECEAIAANSLSSGIQLFNHILRLWTNMSDEEFKVLQNSISPIVSDSMEQGWEESVDAAVTHLLRTTLAKSAKDPTLNPQPLKIPDDITKVKKHIALLCDKLGKGARLVEGLPTNAAGNDVFFIPQTKVDRKHKVPTVHRTIIENGESESPDDTETLIGSQFAEARQKNKDYSSHSVNGLGKLKSLRSPNASAQKDHSEMRRQQNIEAMHYSVIQLYLEYFETFRPLTIRL